MPARGGHAKHLLTKCLGEAGSRAAICADCHGKGFDLTRAPGARHCRRCPRCRGRGFTVWDTKRK